MSRIVPVVIAVIAIAALTIVEGRLSDRWGDNRHCSYCATLLDQVPKEVGQWVGEDNKVTEVERKGAGARGYVSRTYKNPGTGEQVGVWFIVGHARDTFRHTPDICYGGSGFTQEREQQRTEVDLGDGKTAAFWTAMFTRPAQFGGTENQRVFWSWFRPRAGSDEPVEWKVPEGKTSSAIRYEFAAAPALYKIYFTTYGPAAEAEDAKSVCLKFAKEFLATVDPILEAANDDIPADFKADDSEAS